jgi:D-arabinose 1-dehydrogenase-like Zn-dependent alcohol dehydrogenase
LIPAGTFPGIEYLRVSAYEVVGVLDAVGPGVGGWTAGQRVGVGWHGGHSGSCDTCPRGAFFARHVAYQITGLTVDGSYGDYMLAPATRWHGSRAS